MKSKYIIGETYNGRVYIGKNRHKQPIVKCNLCGKESQTTLSMNLPCMCVSQNKRRKYKVGEIYNGRMFIKNNKGGGHVLKCLECGRISNSNISEGYSCVCHRPLKYKVGDIIQDRTIIEYIGGGHYIFQCNECMKYTHCSPTNIIGRQCSCKYIKYHIGKIYNGRMLVEKTGDRYMLKCKLCGSLRNSHVNFKCNHYKLGTDIMYDKYMGIENISKENEQHM